MPATLEQLMVDLTPSRTDEELEKLVQLLPKQSMAEIQTFAASLIEGDAVLRRLAEMRARVLLEQEIIRRVTALSN